MSNNDTNLVGVECQHQEARRPKYEVRLRRTDGACLGTTVAGLALRAGMNALKKALRRCEREVERLGEENASLRYSAESFSALAERLNKRLLALRLPGVRRVHEGPVDKPVAADSPRRDP